MSSAGPKPLNFPCADDLTPAFAPRKLASMAPRHSAIDVPTARISGGVGVVVGSGLIIELVLLAANPHREDQAH